uniref:Uncharacterized protein n=1 Tax=Globodera rostochiensis TaxID=31243 RepID=A0A914H3K8_GLORO
MDNILGVGWEETLEKKKQRPPTPRERAVSVPPFRSQPVRSRPFRSQPVRSRPFRSRPFRSQTFFIYKQTTTLNRRIGGSSVHFLARIQASGTSSNVLRTEQKSRDADFARFVMGEEPPKKAEKFRRADAQILRLVERYDPLNIVEMLRGISRCYVMDPEAEA